MACTSQFLDILAAVAMVVAAPGAEERTDEERMEALLTLTLTLTLTHSQFLDILAAVAMVVAAPGAEERTDEERMEALLLVHVKCVRADPLDADPFAKWWEMKLDSQADGPWYEQRCRGGGKWRIS
jgi:hypothetical protein